MALNRIMSSSLVTVHIDDTLGQVREIFEKESFHHLLVVDSNKLVGVISDRDLLKSISPTVGTVAETARDAATLNKRVHQIMTRKPISIVEDSNIYEAIELFNRHNISCVPVVDKAVKPVGIISWRDILKTIEAKRNERIGKETPDD